MGGAGIQADWIAVECYTANLHALFIPSQTEERQLLRERAESSKVMVQTLMTVKGVDVCGSGIKRFVR